MKASDRSMKQISVLIGLVFILGLNSFAQTIADFERKYPSGKFFEVRPEILMTAQVDRAGQVCSVLLQPNRYSKSLKTAYVGNMTLNPADVMDILDDIIPPVTRDGHGKSAGHVVQDGMVFGGFIYDNVQINTMTSLQSKPGKPGKETKGRQGSVMELEKFLNPTWGPPETVFISWTKRSCAE